MNHQTTSSVHEVEGMKVERLTLKQIKAYEHNPRHAANVQYERIKDSIRLDGLDQPLVVTRRPGESRFVLHSGGNTRLQALQELFAETNDARFGEVDCIVRPWIEESIVLLAHLKENDLRGALTFYDKALAIVQVRELLYARGEPEISQRQFSKRLREGGFSLSQSLISQMTYAATRLAPLLPQALGNGLGRPQVENIRALDRVARQLWTERKVGDDAQYTVAFETLCKRDDAPDWHFGTFRRAIEAEIASMADRSIHAVSFEIDARLESSPSSGGFCMTDYDRAADEDGEFEPLVAATSSLDESTNEQPAANPNTASTSEGENENNPLSRAGAKTSAKSKNDQASNMPRNIKSLRARLWTLATKLARRHGLESLVAPLHGTGLGFILTDVPDPVLVEQLDEDGVAQVSMMWWHLAACAEMTVAPLEALLPRLSLESVLHRALSDQDAGLLFASVWTLDPGHLGYRLWRQADDRDWQDLTAMMDTYRAVHHLAATTGVSLWSDS